MPATRIALESGKLRHQIITGKDGEIDEEFNNCNMALMLLKVDKENHSMVQCLEDKGYECAKLLKRNVERKSRQGSEENENSKTVYGLSEYQRKLAKASTPGSQFHLTKGGAPTNTDDYLVGIELKAWDEEAKQLQKRKKAVYQQQRLVALAKHCAGKTKPQKWNMGTLKNNIQAKDTNVTTTMFKGLSRKELLDMWMKKYSKVKNAEVKWTKADQKLLERLESGKVESYEKTGVYKQAVEGRLQFLATQLENIPQSHALALAIKVLANAYSSKKEALDFVSIFFDINHTAVPFELSGR